MEEAECRNNARALVSAQSGYEMFRTRLSADRSLAARIRRARQSGYADGGREAGLMLIALGKKFDKTKAIGWLNTAVEKGRAAKLRRRRIDCEIDAWEMSCRIMFVVTMAASQRWSR